MSYHELGLKSYRSTCNQIRRVSEIILRGFKKNQYSTAIFLDQTEAFNFRQHDQIENTSSKPFNSSKQIAHSKVFTFNFTKLRQGLLKVQF